MSVCLYSNHGSPGSVIVRKFGIRDSWGGERLNQPQNQPFSPSKVQYLKSFNFFPKHKSLGHLPSSQYNQYMLYVFIFLFHKFSSPFCPKFYHLVPLVPQNNKPLTWVGSFQGLAPRISTLLALSTLSCPGDSMRDLQSFFRHEVV